MSPSLAASLREMRACRTAATIGRASELLVAELIEAATFTVGRRSWRLRCERLPEWAEHAGLSWKPRFGIRCDDLAVLGLSRTHGTCLLIAECKGTISTRGVSRNTEAKMFYQLARTFEKLKTTRVVDPAAELLGIVSAVVNHAMGVITLNVNDRRSSMAGAFPDRWMYRDRAGEPL
jgi:hypothetical protein